MPNITILGIHGGHLLNKSYAIDLASEDVIEYHVLVHCAFYWMIGNL